MLFGGRMGLARAMAIGAAELKRPEAKRTSDGQMGAAVNQDRPWTLK